MFKKQKISTFLSMSFTAVFVMMIAIFTVSLFVLNNISKHSNTMTQLRTPTIQASTQMENGINQALANLRGWILLSDEHFKTERADAWTNILSAKKEMQKVSLHWTNPQNIIRFQNMLSILEDFEKIQNEIESIAGSKENIPSTNLLFQQAVPRANIIMKQITIMIDLEKNNNLSSERKILFSTMADFRGTMAISLVNIRTYLFSGENLYKENFDESWLKNKQYFNQLISKQSLFNSAQSQAFKALKDVRKEFVSLPEKMFSLRAKDNWNKANYMLKTKAVPVGAQLITILRAMVVDQHGLLKEEGITIQSSINEFIILLAILIFSAMSFLIGLAVYIIKRINNPINQAVNIAERVAKGDFKINPASISSSSFYETEQLLTALHKMAGDLNSMIEKTIASESKVKSIVENAVDAIITINGLGVIQTFNTAAISMFGYAEHDVIGKNVKILMPNPYKDEHDAYLSHYRTTGEKKIIGIGREVIAQRKNGTTFPIDLAVSEIISIGSDKLFTGIIRDLSENKSKELELQLSMEAANKANKAKSEFLSSMSHELRTPMNAVLGFSQLLIIDDKNPLNKKQSESVNEIIDAGEHLLELINQVLDLSKIEAGYESFCIESISTKEIIEQTCTLIQSQANQHSITLEHKVVGKNDFNIKADHIKLKQVLLNLASNAVKYNSDNGALIFSSQKTEKNKIRLNVSDTGHGVPEELLPSLFEPFNRLDKANSNIQGTGIGLTICKQLVELMEGKIGVFKNPDKGLTFWVEFDEA